MTTRPIRHFRSLLDLSTMTMAVNGKQYIVQALGGTPGFGRDEPWKSEFGSLVVAFTLE